MKLKYRGVKEEIQTMVFWGAIYPRFVTVSIVPQKETENCKNIISRITIRFIDPYEILN